MSGGFAKVAQELANGDPVPPWLPAALKHFARVIGHHRIDEDDTIERKMIEAAKYLEQWLPMYIRIEEEFGLGFEHPECVETTLVGLHELIEFLEEDIPRPAPRKGGPRPDGRRMVCAGVCAEAYRMLHSREKVEPYSRVLQRSCEEYWFACTGEHTKGCDEPKNWQDHLLKTAKGDEALRAILEQFRMSHP
jgi:hypothetical protein